MNGVMAMGAMVDAFAVASALQRDSLCVCICSCAILSFHFSCTLDNEILHGEMVNKNLVRERTEPRMSYGHTHTYTHCNSDQLSSHTYTHWKVFRLLFLSISFLVCFFFSHFCKLRVIWLCSSRISLSFELDEYGMCVCICASDLYNSIFRLYSF